MNQDLPLLGLGLPVSGRWATPATMIHLAREAEARGYASLWTFQRLLQPVEGALDPGWEASHNPSARPVADDAYRSVHDAVLPLALVAGHTSRIGLGTATLCAPFVAPVVLAKQMATLDHLSGGRVSVGLGIGWLPQEYAAAGVPFERRGSRMEEYLRCLVALWTEDPVEFSGEHYTVPRSHVGPRPVQDPHPPVLLGGAADAALDRAGRLAQGWIGGTGTDLGRLERSVGLVRAGAERVGRDPGAVRVLLRAVVLLADADPGPGRRPFHGTREQVRDDLARVRAAGATEVFVDLNFGQGARDADPRRAVEDVEHLLDSLAPTRLAVD